MGICGPIPEGATEEEVSAIVDKAATKNIIFVPDRPFNDLRYPLDCQKLLELGWKEQESWQEGLAKTVDWYKKFSGNWANVESALVAHPRRGWTG
jgi:UDP-glucose 4,6-dehydratase